MFGHLLPYALERGEASFVAVLRCEPSALKARLERRGYAQAKARENVEAELIGVLTEECLRRFGLSRVREYDTTSAAPERVAAAIARDVSRGRPYRPSKRVDWTLSYDSSSKLRSLLEDGAGPPAST